MNQDQSADVGAFRNNPTPAPNELPAAAFSQCRKFRVEKVNFGPAPGQPGFEGPEPTPDNPEPTPGPISVTARLFDGQNVGKVDYTILTNRPLPVGATIYAISVMDTDPLEWIELIRIPSGARRFDVLGCIDDNQTLAWGRPRFAKRA